MTPLIVALCNLQIAEHPHIKSIGKAASADHPYKAHRRKIKSLLSPIAVSAGRALN